MLTRSERRWSLVIWSSWLTSFLILELLGYSRRAPWRTLSTSVWSLEGRWALLRIVADGGLAALRTHIVNAPAKTAR